MTKDDETLTIIVDRDTKARIRALVKLDDRRSINSWFHAYFGDALMEVIQKQEAYYKSSRHKPDWRPKLGGSEGDTSPPQTVDPKSSS